MIELVAIPPDDDVIDRFDAFEIACGRASGIAIDRRVDRLLIAIPGERISRLGPVVEAASVITGARLYVRHGDRDWKVSLGTDLDSPPSTIWQAMAADADPFRYLSTSTVAGDLVIEDARSTGIESDPGESTDGLGATKFDDVDFHEDAAIAAGQPIENAFAHIGLFLAWAIRRDLHSDLAFPPGVVDAIKRGDATGADLAAVTDGKLLDNMLSHEGASFAAARYRSYLETFPEVFAQYVEYGVPGDHEAARRTDIALDQSYADWVTAGRPSD